MTNQFTGYWDRDKVAHLTQMWADGLSLSKIAERFPNCTRNMVMGKVTRLGLSARGNSFHKRTKPKTVFGKPRVAPPKPLPLIQDGKSDLVPEPRVVSLERRVGVLGLAPESCKWPIGDPQAPDFHFCDQKAMAGASYCEPHMRRAYTPVRVGRPMPAAAKTVVGPIVVDSDVLMEDA